MKWRLVKHLWIISKLTFLQHDKLVACFYWSFPQLRHDFGPHLFYSHFISEYINEVDTFPLTLTFLSVEKLLLMQTTLSYRHDTTHISHPGHIVVPDSTGDPPLLYIWLWHWLPAEDGRHSTQGQASVGQHRQVWLYQKRDPCTTKSNPVWEPQTGDHMGLPFWSWFIQDPATSTLEDIHGTFQDQ